MQRSANLLIRRVNDFLTPTRPEPLPLPLPDHLVPLPSTEGVSLLMAGGLVDDYLRLSAHYVVQDTPKFCGPATIAICLNALDLTPPESADGHPPKFTQHNIFTPRTEGLRTRDQVSREGMGLSVLGEFVAAHGGAPEVRFAGEGSLDSFRAEALDALADPNRYVAVNYFRPALGQEGKGHTSPLAAYDEASDRFLVLDTSRVRYPPVWGRAEDLFTAMNTRAGQRTRGFAIIGRA